MIENLDTKIYYDKKNIDGRRHKIDTQLTQLFFLVMVDCIYNLQSTRLDECHRPKKKSLKSGKIYIKDAQFVVNLTTFE